MFDACTYCHSIIKYHKKSKYFRNGEFELKVKCQSTDRLNSLTSNLSCFRQMPLLLFPLAHITVRYYHYFNAIFSPHIIINRRSKRSFEQVCLDVNDVIITLSPEFILFIWELIFVGNFIFFE